MKQWTRLLGIVGLAVLLALLPCSCAPTGGAASASRIPAGPGDSMIVVPPSVEFLNVFNGNKLDATAERSSDVGRRMADALVGQLVSMGVSAESGPRSTGGRVLSGNLAVHQGPGGTWDPNSGAITSTSSRLVLDLNLTSGGRTQWRQTAMLRSALSSNGGELKKLSIIALGQ